MQESSLLLGVAGKKWMISGLQADKTCSGGSTGSGIWQEVGGERDMCD